MNKLTTIANFYCTDKGTAYESCHGFTEHYQQYFEKYTNPTILELGVFYGASVRTLNEFYGGNCKIYTCDINPHCGITLKGMPNVEFFQVDLGSEESISEFLEKIKHIKFDIIIDDASHKCTDQMRALYAFYRLLKPDGIFIMEDMHTSLACELPQFTTLEFLALNYPVGIIAMEREQEILEHLKDVHIISLRNYTKYTEVFGRRSVTSVLTFE